MSNKKVIRETFDREFGINVVHNEIVSKIKRKENHQTMKLILTLTSIILIATLSVILLLGNNNISKKYDETKVHDVIKINKLKLDDAKIRLNDVDGRMDDKNSEEILLEYQFINKLISKDMLQNVKISEVYASNNKNSDLYNKLIGYYTSYLKEDSNKLINIFFSKTNKKIARCFPIIEENLEKSSVNNNEIIIIDENYGYIVLFKYNDIYFDIEAENINIDELLEIVKSIMI